VRWVIVKSNQTYFSNKRAKIRDMEIKTVITNSYEFMQKVGALPEMIHF